MFRTTDVGVPHVCYVVCSVVDLRRCSLVSHTLPVYVVRCLYVGFRTFRSRWTLIALNVTLLRLFTVLVRVWFHYVHVCCWRLRCCCYSRVVVLCFRLRSSFVPVRSVDLLLPRLFGCCFVPFVFVCWAVAFLCLRLFVSPFRCFLERCWPLFVVVRCSRSVAVAGLFVYVEHHAVWFIRCFRCWLTVRLHVAGSLRLRLFPTGLFPTLRSVTFTTVDFVPRLFTLGGSGWTFGLLDGRCCAVLLLFPVHCCCLNVGALLR